MKQIIHKSCISKPALDISKPPWKGKNVSPDIFTVPCTMRNIEI